ncbi:Flagellum-specific peptidoglycan hydrolase FlgJ [Flavobacterium swingsii]|uniref:Peptidoglycan hydrolase n=1 Tax=Flavobacterium swingsii TaxID=498292 RepID=A0A1I0VG57_9FLAO|nr:glucosaminidase domain-containing protein [Flavobacterium swingsii]SFA75459.1 Flagellum-specific peptidoglycan hydrolase FlgJ [Flavobacterium swingsii]
MNKIAFLILVSLLVSCGASKPKVQPRKTAHATQKTTVKQKVETPVEKVVIKTPEKENAPPKIEVLEATQKVRVTTEMVLAYIAQFKVVAKENMVRDGIPASITLAQGILESGAGTGDLSVQANNHFGIKCHKEWTGPSIKHDDDTAQECFRKYEHAEESYRDHSYFLTSRAWYKPLFSLPKNNYKAWARGLKKAGYATDVKYPEKLIGIIERYELQQYDAEVLGIDFPVKPLDKKEEIADNESQYVVIKGDTLYSLSKKFNITIDELKKKNNIIDNNLSLGQSIIIK